MVTPLDIFGRPDHLEPRTPPAPAPEPEQDSVFRPALVIEVGPPPGDAYERPVGSVLKVFPTGPGHRFVRIGIRHDRQRVETRLSPARMRQLADDLNARADLLDPPGATS